MPNLDEIGGWITEQLPALVAKYKVPGAAIGVCRDGEVFDFAAGVLSHATKVEATTDSVFQIGSITKTWTATLIMQLADEGLLDIDQPVVAYLPDFDLADSAAAKAMTVRQLPALAGSPRSLLMSPRARGRAGPRSPHRGT